VRSLRFSRTFELVDPYSSVFFRAGADGSRTATNAPQPALVSASRTLTCFPARSPSIGSSCTSSSPALVFCCMRTWVGAGVSAHSCVSSGSRRRSVPEPVQAGAGESACPHYTEAEFAAPLTSADQRMDVGSSDIAVHQAAACAKSFASLMSDGAVRPL